MADSDLAELRKQCITSLYLCTDNVSKYLDSEKEAEFEKLKSYVEDYCLLEANHDVAANALEKAKRETDSSNIDSLEERFSAHMDAMAGKRLNTNNHPYMREFNKKVEAGRAQARRNLDESDLAITETQEHYIDPITKKQIVDPVKNKICGHVYEKESIFDILRMRGRSRCPVVGCGNRTHITKDDLIEDEEMRFRMTITQQSTMIQDRSVTNLDNSME